MPTDDHPIADRRPATAVPPYGAGDDTAERGSSIWSLLLWVTLGYTVFVIYGSLVPLHFRPKSVAAAWGQFQRIPYLDLGIGSRADWVANILLFVPLAYCWHGLLWPPRGRVARGFVSMLVLCGCLALSVAIEFAQIFFPPRTVSLNDVIAEVTGAVIGTVLWWGTGRRVVDWLAGWAQAHTPTGMAERLLYAYLFLLFGYNVMPLDLTISGVEIYHKWRDGRILLVPFSAVYDTWAQRVYALAADVAIWIPAAFLWRLSSPKPARTVVAYVVACAAVIEIVQIFVYSRVTSTTDLLTAGCGAAIGAMLAGWLRPAGGTAATTDSNGFAGTATLVWVFATAAWTGVIMAVFWYPFDFNTDWGFVHGRLATLQRVPFEAYYFGTEFRALTEVFHKTGFFFPLGALLAIGMSDVSRRLPVPPVWLYAACGLIIAMVAAGIEAGQLLLPGKNADPTDFLLKVLGAVIGFVVMRLLHKPVRSSIDVQRSSSGDGFNGRQVHGSAPQFTATAREEHCDSQSGRRDRKWSRYIWLWGPIAMVGVVWVATHSALAPYNLRKLVQTPVPLLSVVGLVAAIYWTLGVPVWLAGRWTVDNRRSLVSAALSVLGYGFGAWLLVRLAVPVEMIEKVVGSPILGWPLELEDVGRFVALFCVPALAGIGGSLFVGFPILRSGETGVARAMWLLVVVALLPACYWVIIESAATDNIVELIEGNGSIVSSICVFAYFSIVAASATLAALYGCLRPRLRWAAWTLVAIGAPVGYLLLHLGLEDVLVKYGKAFSAMQFLLSASRESYAAPIELVFRFLVAHTGIVAAGALCQAPFWAWQRAARDRSDKSSMAPPVLEGAPAHDSRGGIDRLR